MPIFPEKARARSGRPISPAWLALEEFVDGFEIPAGKIQSRVSESPDQVGYFTRRPQNAPRFRFRCRVSGTTARVGMGFLNLETPRMGADLLTLDGRDDRGEDTGRIPELILNDFANYGGPDPGTGSSIIALRVVINLAAGEPAKLERPRDWLTVVHRRAMPGGIYRGGSPIVLEGADRVALWPLAKLYWTADLSRIDRYFPVTMHNLQFRLELGAVDEKTGTKGPDLGWFFGVT